jgi:hypothetical protein
MEKQDWKDGGWSCTTCDNGMSYQPAFWAELPDKSGLAIVLAQDPSASEPDSVVACHFVDEEGDPAETHVMVINWGLEEVYANVTFVAKAYGVEPPSVDSVRRAMGEVLSVG